MADGIQPEEVSTSGEDNLRVMAKAQTQGNTLDATTATASTSAPKTNGSDSSKGGLTETSIGSEVDRILNMINVNGFIKDDKALPEASRSQVEPELQPVLQPQSKGEDVKVNGGLEIPPVTSILAKFISSATPTLLTSDLREQLSECILDFVAVTAAGATIAPSSEPILRGLLAFNGAQSTSPGCTVLTRGQSYPPHYAALLNATYGHSLDFDDTHAVSSLHAGVTAIATALAESETMLRAKPTATTSDDILLAMLLGYETTIRIGIALSPASYSRGFHITSTAGIFGAIATISSFRKLSPEVIINAFGLAGSKAAGSMQYLANGSHNKRLHPGFAAHDAFLCVSLAEAGVIGADKIVEGDLGLLQAYTDRERSDVDWSRLIGDLGERWEFADSALKPYAGCRMTHCFIELADHLGKSLREGKWADKGVQGIKKIRCLMPKANMILIGQKLPNKIHPENMVDAQFSCYYQVANAVIHGGTHDMAAYDRLQDSEIRTMSDKIECIVDESVTKMGAKMDVLLEDEHGEVVEIVRREMEEPLGERTHPFVRELVEEKFMGLMRPIYGEGQSNDVRKLVYEMTSGKGDIVKLLDLVSKPV